jgi:site-specific DNA recombinase
MATNPGLVRAGLYCRISDDRAGGGLGVERQRKDCAKLATVLGWQVVDTYTDNDISAYSGRRRPEYERLLMDLTCGRIDAVVTWHLDRLNRSPVELERLIPLLERHNVQVQTVTAGVLDIGTPSGRAVARTLGVWARFESEHKSERQRAKMLELAKLGRITSGGNRPYGYAADKVTVIPAEAKIVREMMRRFLAGTSTAQLCHELTARGVPAPGTRPWRSGTLAQILQTPRIAGWRQTPPDSHHSRDKRVGFLVRAQWPAIVSRRDVERAIALMSDETLRPGSNRRWLLSRIATCGACGLPLSRIQYASIPHRYTCARGAWSSDQQCAHVSINAEFLDQLVVDRLLQAVAGNLIQRITDLDGDPYAPTAESVRLDEIQLASLGRDYDDGVISRPEWRKRRDRITERVRTARAALADAPDPATLAALARAPKRFPKTWQAATLREQRALLRTLTKEIRIAPATSRNNWVFDEQRVQITWRA